MDYIVIQVLMAGPKRKSTTGSKGPRPTSATDDEDARTARKEKVLHARIPEALDREIKGRARNLGLSVSTVVRHVLMHTFDLVEDIVSDSTNIALSIAGDAPRRAAPPGNASRPQTEAEPSVIGWQQVVLQRNAVCERCNAILERGKAAAIAVHDVPAQRTRPVQPTIVCQSCLEALTCATADADPGNDE